MFNKVQNSSLHFRITTFYKDGIIPEIYKWSPNYLELLFLNNLQTSQFQNIWWLFTVGVVKTLKKAYMFTDEQFCYMWLIGWVNLIPLSHYDQVFSFFCDG